jgi:hypothetical protein
LVQFGRLVTLRERWLVITPSNMDHTMTRLPSLFIFCHVTALYSPIFPATRPARLISAFRSFLSAHQSSVYPRYGEHRLRQAAQRFSPCSCLLPRSFCSLSSSLLSRALLLSSRLLSLILCLLLSSSPYLLLFSPSSSPPLLLCSTGRLPVPRTPRSAKLAFPHV